MNEYAVGSLLAAACAGAASTGGRLARPTSRRQNQRRLPARPAGRGAGPPCTPALHLHPVANPSYPWRKAAGPTRHAHPRHGPRRAGQSSFAQSPRCRSGCRCPHASSIWCLRVPDFQSRDEKMASGSRTQCQWSSRCYSGTVCR